MIYSLIPIGIIIFFGMGLWFGLHRVKRLIVKYKQLKRENRLLRKALDGEMEGPDGMNEATDLW